jgi:hypothetical protein
MLRAGIVRPRELNEADFVAAQLPSRLRVSTTQGAASADCYPPVRDIPRTRWRAIGDRHVSTLSDIQLESAQR